MIDRLIGEAEAVLAKACLALATVLVVLGALARLAGEPLIWAIDVALLLFAWCCVFGADLALRGNRHIEIDVLIRRFPASLTRVLALLWLVVIGAFLGILVVYGAQLTFLNVERPLGDTEISYAFVTASIPVGAVLMLWTVVRRLLRALAGRESLSLEGRDGTVL